MRRARRFVLRNAWVQFHLWLGLTLGVVGALLGLSGCVLVYDHAVDAYLHPSRYAISGAQVALPIAEYAQRAEAALGGARVFELRFAEGRAEPVLAILRGDGGMQRVYLDPPTARVLDIGSGNDVVAWLHQFHESLTLRDFGGRSIVGVVGIAMLVSALTGIYLWWPANGLGSTGLGFRRGLALHRNIHYTIGICGVVLLAMLSFTGIFLGFPDAGRTLVGAMAKVSAAPRGLQSGEGTGRGIGPDDAAGIALADYPSAAVVGVGFPAGPRGVYRISLRERGDTDARPGTVVFIDPRTRSVIARTDRKSRGGGDTFLAWQRMLHEGSAFGGIGRFPVFVGGLMPAVLVVTGLLMWLRQRRRRSTSTAAVGST